MWLTVQNVISTRIDLSDLGNDLQVVNILSTPLNSPQTHNLFYCMHDFLFWLVLYRYSARENFLYSYAQPHSHGLTSVSSSFPPVISYVQSLFITLEPTLRSHMQMLLNIYQMHVDYFRREQCIFSQLQLPFILYAIQETFLQFVRACQNPK